MRTERSPIFRNKPCEVGELTQREREFLAFFREGGPRAPDFVREMLKSADDRAAVRRLWDCRLVGVVQGPAGEELWGMLPEGPKRGRIRALILEGETLSSSERSYVRRLHYLVDVLMLTMQGTPVTVDTISERIEPEVTLRHAERLMADLLELSRELGHPAWRQPFDMVHGDVAYLERGEKSEEGGRWAFRVRHPDRLLTRVQNEIEKYVPRDREKTSADYALEYARHKESGLCVHCHKVPPQPGSVSCADCLRSFRDRIRKRVEAGICPTCREPIGDPGFSSCARCRAKLRRLEKKRREQGLCPECGEPAAEGRAYCGEHAERATEYHAERYFGLKEKGLCRCKRPLEPGRSTCAECRQQQEAAEEYRLAERRTKSLCLRCGSPVVPGLTTCDKHREAHRLESRSKRERLKAAGLCRSCRKPWVGEELDCSECRQRFAAAKAAKAAQGLCQNCGVKKRVEGQKRCRTCIDAAKARYESLKAQGICVTCKKNKVSEQGDTVCATCRQKTRDRYLAKRGGQP